jgi:hypothetical protein
VREEKAGQTEREREREREARERERRRESEREREEAYLGAAGEERAWRSRAHAPFAPP